MLLRVYGFATYTYNFKFINCPETFEVVLEHLNKQGLIKNEIPFWVYLNLKYSNVIKMVEILFEKSQEYGIDLYAKNDDGMTLLDIARTNNDTEESESDF